MEVDKPSSDKKETPSPPEVVAQNQPSPGSTVPSPNYSSMNQLQAAPQSPQMPSGPATQG